jgi:hypothetical protein
MNVAVHYIRANRPRPWLELDHICVEGTLFLLSYVSEGLSAMTYTDSI